MSRSSFIRRVIAIAIVAITTAACSSITANPAEGRVIAITMREFTFSPRTITVNAGEKVTLTFANEGTIEHEFMAGRVAVPSRGYSDDWLKRAIPGLASHTHPGEEHLGEGIRVSSDWPGRITLVVPQERGTYEFGCFIAGHYEAGMKGTIVVR